MPCRHCMGGLMRVIQLLNFDSDKWFAATTVPRDCYDPRSALQGLKQQSFPQMPPSICVVL